MKKIEIEKIIETRFKDAEVLFESSRYDGAIYLCGYAIELYLKARICNILQWEAYPTGNNYRTFKTHDLDILLHLTGLEDKVKLKHMSAWSIVSQWNPEARYNPIGNAKEADAKDMIESTKELITKL